MKSSKKNLLVIILLVFIFGKLFLIKDAKAQYQVSAPVTDTKIDATNKLLSTEQKKVKEKEAEDKKKETAAKEKEKKDKTKLGIWGEAFGNALQVFSRQVAYNVAMKIAQGGSGGKALTWGTAWPDYIEKAGQAALGDFLGSMSNVTGYNLCDPGKLGKFDMITRITMDVVSPNKPRCDWKDIQQNWKTMDQGKFLDKLSHEFDPNTNELGTYFAMQREMQSEVKRKVEIADHLRGYVEDKGYQPVVDKISGFVKTPQSMVEYIAKQPIEKANSIDQTTWLGQYVLSPFLAENLYSPAVGTFLSTLTGQLMNKWLNKGMFDYSAYDAYQAIFNPSGSGTNVASDQALQYQHGSIMQARFTAGGNYDVVSNLATCPFGINSKPDECVLDPHFSLAIEQKMPVGDALNAGFLNKDGTFGFETNGSEPAYNEGYPFRSMKILRKYRILPVGWEIAAEYINKFSAKKRYSLQEIVDCYSPDDRWNKTGTSEDWCYGLVDPDWLLKAPANNCEKKALAGQVITSEQVIDGIDGDENGVYYDLLATGDKAQQDDNDKPAAISVSRDEFCAVDKSCINETSDGKCLKWGYCTEEKRIWRLNGETCDEQCNTCQTFTKNDASGNAGAVSYLKNTLDYGGCDSSNAGCKWYCADYDYDSKNWTCSIGRDTINRVSTTGETLYFNKNSEKCDEKNEGCHEFIRLRSNVNLIYNGNLEEGNSETYNGTDAKFNDWPVEKSSGALTLKKEIDGTKGSFIYKFEADKEGAGIYSYDAVAATEKSYSMMPEGYAFDEEKNYILSADVMVEKGKVEVGFENPAVSSSEWVKAENKGNGTWERIQVFLASGKYAPSKIYVHNSSLDSDGKAVFSVDNISLYETADQASALSYYKNYADQSDAIKIKKAPAYLGCGTPSAKSECSNYAAECSASEVGCSKYTPANGEPWISAIIAEEDKCDKECLNYKSYKQSATNFSREVADVKFIADNPYADGLGGDACPAEVMGCAEFTNLDELEKGGEQKEYYTYLKQCVPVDSISDTPEVPDTSANVHCGTFYTWTGSDANGLQLKTYYLEKTSSGAPVMINNPRDLGKCEGADDVKNNPEHCKEFYDEAKAVSYAILENTVTCSENCHPYRKTKEDISRSACLLGRSSWIAVPADEISSPAAAKALSGECSGSDCVCKLEIENCVYSGGKWKDGGCVYMAIPDEGVKCGAEDNGCNEYKGSSSGNIKIVLKNDFEDKTNGGWTNGSPSNEAYVGGEQSLTLADGSTAGYVQKDLGGILKKDKNYEISFLANNTGTSDKELTVAMAGNNFYTIRKITLKADSLPWQGHIASSLVLTGDLNEDGQINADDLAILNRAAADKMSVSARQRELADIDGDGDITGGHNDIAGEDADLLSAFISVARPSSQLIIIGGMDANTFIDNIVLTEVQENIYRIKDTWTVPDKCDSPTFAAQLGCAEYNDINGNLIQLKSFNNVCSAKAIGCEKMIDTQNSNSAISQTFSAGASLVTVPRDKVAYLVNSHPCDSKGCQKFGVPNLKQDKTALSEYSSDVYLVNDPDKYGSILCAENALWCEEYNWSSGESAGTAYFKDPKEKVCEYKNGRWYEKDSTTECPTVKDINLTIGSAPVDVPKEGWAGICPAKQSGCEEFIDPLSDNEPNIVFNGDFEQDAQALSGGTGDGPDGWTNVLGCKAGADHCCANGFSGTKAIQRGEQEIVLSADTLYTLSARVNGTGSISINNCELLSPDNSMAITVNFAKLEFNNMPLPMGIKSGRFYVKETSAAGSCTLKIATDLSGDTGGFVDDVNIQKTGIYYYLADSINAGDCASSNPSKGCILINERQFKWDSAGNAPSHKGLTESVDKAYSGESSSCANDPSCVASANRLIKADPDRVCGKWLIETNKEKTETGEFKTRTIGECVAADASGACTRQVFEEQHDVNFKKGSVSLMKNVSGLSKVGFEWSDGNKIEGYYPLSAMPQIGQYIDFPGGFELAILNGKNGTKPDDDPKWWKPAGWDLDGDGNWWEGFETITDPVFAQKEGLDKKAPAGKNFLKLNGSHIAKLSDELPVYEGAAYTITGYINTKGIQTPKTKSGIYLEALDSKGAPIAGGEWKLEISEGLDWTEVAQKIDMPPALGARKLQIRLKNKNEDEVAVNGSSYFDEITIMPALKKQDASVSFTKEEIAPSICKAYPEQDSLSCEYTKDNITYVGERGYCLEYDSAPGDPNTCVNWFPIDVIRGEEGKKVPPVTFAGYGKGPLYYCLEGQFLETRVLTIASFDNKNIMCPEGYCQIKQKVNAGKEAYYFCEPNEPSVAGQLGQSGKFWPQWACGKNASAPSCGLSPELFYYNGGLAKINTYTKERGCQAHNSQEDFMVRCTKVVQVATVEGDSQIWATRVNPASKYAIKNLYEVTNDGTGKEYNYWSSSPVYGALAMGTNGSDVTTWDADEKLKDKQPLSIEINWDSAAVNLDTGKPEGAYAWRSSGMGLPYSCSNPNYEQCVSPGGNQYYTDKTVQRSISVGVKNDLKAAQDKLKELFTKSYNVWEWKRGDKNTPAGYALVADNKFNYLELIPGSKTSTVTCPPASLVRPAQALTWLTDKGIETCFIPWKWVVEDIIIPPASSGDSPDTRHVEEYRIDQTFTDEELKDFKCDKETLAFKLEDILTNDVLPKKETYQEIQKNEDDGECYNNTITYTETLADIGEEKIASGTVGVKTITASSELSIIAKTMQKGSDYYQYTITYNRTKTAIPGIKVVCPDIISKKVREGDKCYNYQYEAISIPATWGPPDKICPAGGRGDLYCGIKPQVKNIKVGEITDKPVNIGIANSVLLKFNTDADPDQQQLNEYYIDWGDGDESIATGKKFMVQPTYPHAFDHYYSFNDLSGKYYNNDPKVIKDIKDVNLKCYKAGSNECKDYGIGACCKVKPRIRITDNWGWCSGKDISRCSNNKSDWAAYGDWIVVTER